MFRAEIRLCGLFNIGYHRHCYHFPVITVRNICFSFLVNCLLVQELLQSDPQK